MLDDMDEVDRQILALLLADGRTPVAQIAEQVGLSRPAVAERMEKLERASVIRGVTAVVDPLAMGQRVTAFISARRPSPLDAKSARAFRALLDRPEIVEAHTVAGDDCYLMKVRTDSIQTLNALVSSMTHEPLGFATKTTIVMESHCEKVGGITLRGGKAL